MEKINKPECVKPECVKHRDEYNSQTGNVECVVCRKRLCTQCLGELSNNDDLRHGYHDME